jgi:N-glycosylase/DNA lyase
MKNYKKLIEEYKHRKVAIKKRLKEFSGIHKGKGEKIFSELCFCILTPQSNAISCDRAIKELKEEGLLAGGRASEVRKILKTRTRFHNKKADYIVLARGCFDKNILRFKDNLKMREWLVRNIKGIGYKEASHFLRNIGLGKDIAILDRHILKNLKLYGAIDRIPPSLTARAYFDIEDKARKFSNKIRIPLEELDLLFWSRETGRIFK